MKFLGLRLCEHDSNVTYTDGTTVKYYKPERDYQVKHFGYKDLSGWTKIIKKWGIDPKEIDAIGIVLDCFRHPYIQCDESKLFENIKVPLFELFGFDCPIFRVDHHYAHLLSCWTLDVESDYGFVFDGFGDDYISHSLFRNEKKIAEHHMCDFDSLGIILGSIGCYIGLDGSGLDHASKLMALKGYGSKKFSPTYQQYDLSSLNKLWYGERFKEKNIDRDFQDICDSVRYCHEHTEKIFVDYFVEKTNTADRIFYSGGISQNTIINSKIKQQRNNLFIPPHCNDEGLSLGIVEFLRMYFDQELFDNSGFPYWQSDESPTNSPSVETIKKTAKFLNEEKIVGWYQGSGEIGARALGNRSILMNPSVKDGKEIINQKVKHREWFRPFGASILEEEVSNYFDWNEESPYMLYVMDVLDKDSFAPVTHIDGTCRVQTVSKDLHNYYSLIDEFKSLSRIPMVLNTSLNNGGKPIAGSIEDALNLFSTTEIDVLVVGDEIYEK
jgi:carbamoyltransferase